MAADALQRGAHARVALQRRQGAGGITVSTPGAGGNANGGGNGNAGGGRPSTPADATPTKAPDASTPAGNGGNGGNGGNDATTTTKAPNTPDPPAVVTISSTAPQPTITVQPTTTAPRTTATPTVALSTLSARLSSFSSVTLAISSSSTLSLASAAASSTTPDSSGVGTGSLIGIIAGSLIGVVVLAGLIGYCCRIKFSSKDDDDDADVFANLDHHRTSVRLADEDPMGEIGGGLARQNTGALMRADTGARYGGAPQPAFYGYGANGQSGGEYGGQQYLGTYGDLQRQATSATATSRYGPEPVFDDQHGPVQSRSGTPTNSNPQMIYTNEVRDSYGSGSGPEQAVRREPAPLVHPEERARRPLSVRNGGLDDYPGGAGTRTSAAYSDAYGGM